MPVEEEKAYTGPNQSAGQDDDIHLPAIDRRQQQGGRHDGDDARRQAIDPIDQVDRVLQPNEPEEGERDRYRHRQVDDVPAGEIHGMDVDAEDDDRQQRGGDLKEELGEGSDPVEVIENHQGGDDRRREEQPEGGRVGREQCRREAESQVHGEPRSEEHTSELQSHHDLVCRLLLEKKKKKTKKNSVKKKKTKTKTQNHVKYIQLILERKQVLKNLGDKTVILDQEKRLITIHRHCTS